MTQSAQPIFRAVTSSTRPLYQLLKCINFATKVHVQFTEGGVRIAAYYSRVMEGRLYVSPPWSG
jgi:cell cycle checkpoint protein